MKHARAAAPDGRRLRAVLVGGFAAVLAAAVGLTANAFAAAAQGCGQTFQRNGPAPSSSRTSRRDVGKLYRSCGNCAKQTARHVVVSTVTVTVPLKSLVGVSSNVGDTAKISNVTVIGGTGKTVIRRSSRASPAANPPRSARCRTASPAPAPTSA